jgi:hypothetical protein
MNWQDAKSVLLPKSNHQQMRNDENTKIQLNALWDGEHGAFFETAIK